VTEAAPLATVVRPTEVEALRRPVAPRRLRQDVDRRHAHRRRSELPDRTGNLGTVKKDQGLTIGWGSDGTDFFHGTLDDVEIDIG
jgi:hypothetical protein